MALSLGVTDGSKIRVGTEILEVVSIVGTAHIQVRVADKNHLITDCERTEVLPGVFVSCGRNDDRQFAASFSRLAFEAPRSIEIKRIGGGHDQGKR